jgi:hypothetical protein
MRADQVGETGSVTTTVPAMQSKKTVADDNTVTPPRTTMVR